MDEEAQCQGAEQRRSGSSSFPAAINRRWSSPRRWCKAQAGHLRRADPWRRCRRHRRNPPSDRHARRRWPRRDRHLVLPAGNPEPVRPHPGVATRPHCRRAFARRGDVGIGDVRGGLLAEGVVVSPTADARLLWLTTAARRDRGTLARPRRRAPDRQTRVRQAPDTQLREARLVWRETDRQGANCRAPKLRQTPRRLTRAREPAQHGLALLVLLFGFVYAASLISGTSGGTISFASVAATTCSTVTPGARSFRTRPSAVGSITARSVTTRLTAPHRGQRQRALLEDLRLALGRMDHGDDHALGAGHQIHGAAHAGNHLARNHPVGEHAALVDLQAAEHGDVDVAAADQAEREGAVKGAGAGDGADEAAARVSQDTRPPDRVREAWSMPISPFSDLKEHQDAGAEGIWRPGWASRCRD